MKQNFEIQKYYQNEHKFNSVYSRKNLPKIKDGTYAINLDEYKAIGPHQIVLYVNAQNVTYFHSFGVKTTYSKRNLKSHRKQKYDNNYIYNTIIRLDNVWILFYCDLLILS